MKWKEFILEIGPGADEYALKRALQDKDSLLIAIDQKKIHKKYPKNMVYGEVSDRILGTKIMDKKRGVDLTIKKGMFKVAHIHQVLLSPEFEKYIYYDHGTGIPQMIKNICEVMRDDGIIVISDSFNALMGGYYKNFVEETLWSCGFRHWKQNEDIHSQWADTYHDTNRCMYATKKKIDKKMEKRIEEIRKYPKKLDDF